MDYSFFYIVTRCQIADNYLVCDENTIQPLSVLPIWCFRLLPDKGHTMKLIVNIILAILFCSPWFAGAACVQGDCTNGYGTAALPRGGRYVGEFREGVRAGRGSMAYPDGTRYEGNWQDDRPHGKGTHFSAGKFDYTGEFANGLRHGQGTLKIVGGKTYVGEWQDDVPHGQGKLTDPGEGEFTGQFMNGRRHGQGETLYSDGARYKGEWADDLPNGQGVKVLADGMQYSGEFRNGSMFGSGMIVLPDGNQLKVKWQSEPPRQNEANLPDTAVSNAADTKEWYMIATPAKDQKPFSLGPAPSAGPMEISPRMLVASEEVPPAEPKLPAGVPEPVSPQAPAENETVAEEKAQTVTLTAIKPGETGEIQPAEAVPARKKNTPEPGVALKHNPETIKAGEYASISVGANIRSTASLTSKILRTVSAGFPVIVMEKQDDWFLVKDFRKRKGWVFAPLVAPPGTVIISVFKGNLRSGPGLQNTIIAQLDHGTIMSVLERSGEWLKVTDSEALTGWLHRKVIWP
jgi:SH3-like domain-containing protein